MPDPNAHAPAAAAPRLARVLSHECMVDAHELCPGSAEITRSGAPYWEPPIATPPCGCTDCGHPQAGA